MELLVQQLTNGIVLGSVYALIAIGFTLTFGVLRLLNMAHGEFYMLGAFLAYWTIVKLGLPALIAVPLTLLLVFMLALAVERVALKPLRNAPHFIPLVSTIAVSTVILEVVRLGFGPYTVSFDIDLSNVSYELGPLRISPLQLFILGLSLSLTVVAQLFLSRSKWGKAIRGTAQDAMVSGLLGINADRVIGLTFAIASVLGGVAGIMIAMYFGAIYPNMGFVALIKAFTAAILGGMGSVPGAVLGGFLLGIAESLGSAYLPSGFSDALPFALLFVVLLVMPGGLTRQQEISSDHHSVLQVGRGLWDVLTARFGRDETDAARSRETLIALGSAVALCAIAPWLSDYALRVLVIIAVYSAMALGTNIILGLAGQLSLCHAAFFAIGAYATALLTTRFGFGWLSAMAVGALAAATLGGLVSLVTFRVRGYYLALVTLAFAEIVRITLGHWTSATGGMMGVRAIPAPHVGPWAIDTPLAFFYLGMAFCAVTFALYDAIAFSVKGRAMLALRDDEVAARATGLPVLRLKISAFVLSAIFPAVGGSIMAHYFTSITPDFALMGETILILVIVVIGGLGSAAGAVFGAIVVNVIPEAFRQFGDFRLLTFGAILLAMIIYQPNGVFSIARRLARRA
jgi:branched-chain amino acid transport system permease protein